MALQLKRHGISRVRPLAGGFDAWREGGYRLEVLPKNAVVAEVAQL